MPVTVPDGELAEPGVTVAIAVFPLLHVPPVVPIPVGMLKVVVVPAQALVVPVIAACAGIVLTVSVMLATPAQPVPPAML